MKITWNFLFSVLFSASSISAAQPAAAVPAVPTQSAQNTPSMQGAQNTPSIQGAQNTSSIQGAQNTQSIQGAQNIQGKQGAQNMPSVIKPPVAAVPPKAKQCNDSQVNIHMDLHKDVTQEERRKMAKLAHGVLKGVSVTNGKLSLTVPKSKSRSKKTTISSSGAKRLDASKCILCQIGWILRSAGGPCSHGVTGGKYFRASTSVATNIRGLKDKESEILSKLAQKDLDGARKHHLLAKLSQIRQLQKEIYKSKFGPRTIGKRRRLGHYKKAQAVSKAPKKRTKTLKRSTHQSKPLKTGRKLATVKRVTVTKTKTMTTHKRKPVSRRKPAGLKRSTSRKKAVVAHSGAKAALKKASSHTKHSSTATRRTRKPRANKQKTIARSKKQRTIARSKKSKTIARSKKQKVIARSKKSAPASTRHSASAPASIPHSTSTPASTPTSIPHSTSTPASTPTPTPHSKSASASTPPREVYTRAQVHQLYARSKPLRNLLERIARTIHRWVMSNAKKQAAHLSKQQTK